MQIFQKLIVIEFIIIKKWDHLQIFYDFLRFSF